MLKPPIALLLLVLAVAVAFATYWHLCGDTSRALENGVEVMRAERPLLGQLEGSAPIPVAPDEPAESAPAESETAGVIAVSAPESEPSSDTAAQAPQRVLIRVDRASPVLPRFRGYDGSVRLVRLQAGSDSSASTVRYAPRPIPLVGWQPGRLSIGAGVGGFGEAAFGEAVYAYLAALPVRVWGFEFGLAGVLGRFGPDVAPAVTVEVHERLDVSGHYLLSEEAVGLAVGYRFGW